MLADDESQNPPQSGRFVVKLQSEDATEAAVLSPFEQTDIPQYWRVVKDRIELFFDDKKYRCVAQRIPDSQRQNLYPERFDRSDVMESMFILVPISIILAFIIGWFFWWSGKNGQFDDLEGPAHRILMDDDSTEKLIEKDEDKESK